jgi:hypothetical protein
VNPDNGSQLPRYIFLVTTNNVCDVVEEFGGVRDGRSGRYKQQPERTWQQQLFGIGSSGTTLVHAHTQANFHYNHNRHGRIDTK